MCILELLLALIITILHNTAVTELQIICMCLVSEIQKLRNFQAVEKHQLLYYIQFTAVYTGSAFANLRFPCELLIFLN